VILYKNHAAGFREDVDGNRIADILERNFIEKLGWCPARERSSWNNSLRAMEAIVRRSRINDDCGVMIEYKIPLSSKRIDFVIAGQDSDKRRNAVIIELKQWQSAEMSDHKDVVVTIFKGGPAETTHPSYQAWSYKSLLQDYNQAVNNGKIGLSSCAYLHNMAMREPEPLLAEVYSEYVSDTPLYFKHDTERLQTFLKQYVGLGSGMEILYEIRNGKICPSKKLVDHVCSLFKGNREFILIDNQKVAYEKALSLARDTDEKTVLIVKGGPGTGKSVISVNLLGGLLGEGQNVVFVAPNAAFRHVMIEKLAREHTKTRLKTLFKGSSGFVGIDENTFDTAIVDEAHRLKNASAYQYRGDNQIEDILRASRTSIMFIDDSQRVRPEDIGSVQAIRETANSLGAKIYEIELEAQFRCSGADGYINWLDHTLQLRQTANHLGWGDCDFDFRIYDDPNKLYSDIRKRNQEGHHARMLAGYAWKWTSERNGNPDGEVEDIVIEEYDFMMPWNSRRSRTTWAIDDSGLDQIGCIHTAQGLEFDYVGVIVGRDLRYDAEEREFRIDWDSYKDVSGKKGLRDKPQELSLLVRNIYKVLLSRGMRGCYVYFCDEKLEKYFKGRLKDPSTASPEEPDEDQSLKAYRNALPIIPLRSVADASYTETEGYLPFESEECTLFPLEGGPFSRDRFLVKAEGDSMEPKICDGDICLFRKDPGGSRNGRIVLCSVSLDSGGSIGLIKRYRSARDVTGRARRIILESINPEHEDIVLDECEQIKVIGIFKGVIQTGNPIWNQL